MHSSSVVQPCCGPVDGERKYDSIPLLAAVGPFVARVSQLLCRRIDKVLYGDFSVAS